LFSSYFNSHNFSNLPCCVAGTVPSGLHLHPDGQHLIYLVGCTIVVENIATKKQEFLAGHTNTVSCLAMSRSGNFIASGQVTYMGFKVTLLFLLCPWPDLHRGHYEMSALSGIVCLSVGLSVCHMPRHNSRAERPRKPRIGTMEAHHAGNP